MTIYNYNEDGYLLGQSVARLDPIEGLPMIPRNATVLPPTGVGNNEIAKFSGGSWSTVPDFTGYEGFDANGNPVSISQPEVLIDPSWSVTKPPPLPRYSNTMSSLTFFNRFTGAEQIAIVTATLSIVPLKIIYDKMMAANFIDVTDTDTIAGVDALIASTLVQASRKSTVLVQEIIQP